MWMNEIKLPWTSQPQVPVQLSETFTKNCYGVWPLTKVLGPSIGANLIPRGMALTAAGTVTDSVAPFGRGAGLASAGDYLYGTDVAFSDAQTLLVVVTLGTVDANNRTIFIKRNSSGVTPGVNELQLAYNSTRFQYAAWDVTDVACLLIDSNIAPVSGRTYAIVISEPINGGVGRMHINGVQVGSATKSAVRNNSSVIFELGAYNGGNNLRFFSGKMANAGWWSWQFPQNLAADVSGNPWQIFAP